MLTFLSKLFIKDYKNYSDSEVRTRYGVLCGGYGIFLNVILFGAKFIAGTISASVAMIADAFNNLSDAASSVVNILGFKLASKKPDPEHPFGHGRIEYVSGLIIAGLIFLMAVELFKSSINSLIKGFSEPTQQEFNLISLIILILAILVKIYMYFYNHSIGKKINSVSLEATAKDSLSDTISTLVVIVSMVLGQFTTFPVDGIAGLVVSVFIFLAGYEAAKETLQPLLGSKPEEDFVKEIEAEVLKHKPIVGIHDLVVHDYGPGRKMISLHAEVPGDMDIFELHDVIDITEVEVATKFGCETVIHLDPIDLKNPQLAKNKEIVSEIVKAIDESLSIHDFRMVPGETHTNLIFDVVKPFDCKIADEVLLSTIREKVLAQLPNHFCVIAVDRPYC